MPDFPPPLIDGRGRLDDFQGGYQGESRQAMDAAHHSGGRRRWGNRVLLAVQPDQNPNLGGLVGKNSATFIDTGDLGRSYPINVQVRFAQVIQANGQPALPFTDLNLPLAIAGNPVVRLHFTVRRGVDPQAPTSQDVYLMDDLSGTVDCAPFDTIAARSLGLDVKIDCNGTLAQQMQSNIWLEAMAVINDNVGVRDTLPGFTDLNRRNFIPANAGSVLLAQQYNSCCQLIICNTSKTGDLYVCFGNGVASPTDATLVLPAGGANVYESPLGGWAGDVFGVWVGGVDGGALVTQGTYKTLHLP